MPFLKSVLQLVSMTPPADEHSGAVAAARTRARRTKPAERHAQLLDIAEQLLADGGSDALRMDTLAQAAGVTRPVVYKHFGNRDGLIVALLQRFTARVAERDAVLVPAGGSFEDNLRAGTRSYLEAAMRSGATIRTLLNSEYLSPVIEAQRRRIWSVAATRWSERYRAWYPLQPAEAHALAARDLAALTVLARLCVDGQLTVDRAVELHITCTLAALTAVSATRSTDA